jgi:hypothetical protein
MKRFGIMFLVGLLSIPLAQAMGFTPPTAEQIAALSADPHGIIKLIKDANPTQAADVLSKGIAGVEASTLKPAEKKQLIARLTAYAVIAMHGDAPAMMAILAGSLTLDELKIVVAAATVADPVQAQAILHEMLKTLGADSEKGQAVIQAAAFPMAVLGGSLHDFLQQLVIGITGGSPFGINNLPPPPTNRPPGLPNLPTRYGK